MPLKTQDHKPLLVREYLLLIDWGSSKGFTWSGYLTGWCLDSCVLCPANFIASNMLPGCLRTLTESMHIRMLRGVSGKLQQKKTSFQSEEIPSSKNYSLLAKQWLFYHTGLVELGCLNTGYNVICYQSCSSGSIVSSTKS